MLLAALGLPQTALGLDPNRGLTQYVHRIWQTQQGLPQGGILQIFQTREGYLWLATQTGLVRFDGVRFQQAEDIIPGAPSNLWVRTALEDQRGALWLGSNESGLYRLGPDGVNQYTTAQGLPSNAIQCLVQSRDGVMWACTDSGLARLDVSRAANRWIQTFPDGCGTDERKCPRGLRGFERRSVGRRRWAARGGSEEWPVHIPRRSREFRRPHRCAPCCAPGIPFGREPATA